MGHSEEANYPITYGDKQNINEKRLSDYVVDVAKDKRVQSHTLAVGAAFLTLGSYGLSARAIPLEYGEGANNVLNAAENAAQGAQAANNAAQGANALHAGQGVNGVLNAGGPIQGQVPNIVYAMPLNDQYRLAAQQQGYIPGPVNLDKPPVPPVENPWFWSPPRPISQKERMIATAVFWASTAGICSQVAWNPIAQIMCSAGLAVASFKVSAQIFKALVKFF